MGNRFADPTVVTRYDLDSGDDWVEFRNELTYGQSRAIEAGSLRSRLDPTTNKVDVEVDWSVHETVRLAAWCAAWSFTTAKGKATRPTRRMIDQLNPSTVAELVALLDAHLDAMDEAVGKDEPGTS